MLDEHVNKMPRAGKGLSDSARGLVFLSDFVLSSYLVNTLRVVGGQVVIIKI